MDDNDNVPAKPEVEIEAEADKKEDATAPEPVSEPAVEAGAEEAVETEPAAESTHTADEKEDDVEVEVEAEAEAAEEAEEEAEVKTQAEVEAQAEADAEVETEAEAEAEVVPAEDDTPTADEAANDTTQDEPEQADAKSEKDLAEQTSELEPADHADPQEPEPGSEPTLEAEEEEPPQAESEPPSEDQPQEGVEEEPAPEEPQSQVEEESEEKEPPHDEPDAEPEVETVEPEAEPEVEAEEDAQRGKSLQPAAEITSTADEAAEDHEEPAAVQGASRSSSSLRRTSGNTEALIHAAAKEVLERLEAQTMETIRNRSHSRQDSAGSTNHGTELHYDVRSGESRRESYNTEPRASRRESYKTESRASRRESYNTQPRSSRRESEFRPPSVHAEDAADSSSQHGDSDVFSDRSPRSSLGSFDGHVDYHKDASHRSSKRSSRNMPDDVSISEMSYYDKEEFVPTIRGTNRMPFRSPSDVRALQYSSPAPSVTGSYSPRSAKRAQIPTISRLGSPTVSGQYSTKGRKTPTRFNPKKEPAPLVLLHVTLLPLRWQWAEILEQTSSDILSPEAKTLREAWHHLHDRVADTVCERGILLSHPQEDYELLEERLLEALDLPLRRRARVLECGHYIGPSNEMTPGEDDDSDEDEYDEDARRRSGALVKTHWCQTCRHDIRYESLGPGKIFRIKVYASNGLMRTGAWAACWKEMERVDVEIEPIVESAVLDELERLVFAQSQQLQLVKHDPAILESTEGRDMPEDRGMSDFDHGMPSMERDMRSLDRGIPALEEPPRREPSHLEENNLLEPSYADREAHIAASSPSPAAGDARSPSPAPMPHYDESEERRLRDEERMREIYGHPPPSESQHHEPAPEPPHSESRHESFSAQSPPPHPPSPAPQQQQQQQQQPEPQQAQSQQYPPHQPAGPEAAYPPRPQGFQNAGLGELLLEAARVFMQDKKNLAIVVMSLLVLFMAVRPAPREVRDWDGKFVEHLAPVVSEPPSTASAAPPLMETVQAVVESVASSEEAPAQVVVVQSTAPDVEAAELNEVPVAEAIASVANERPAQSTSATATSQTSAVEEETPSPAATSSSLSEEVMAPAAPTPVHETIVTRELVRIIETVTETVRAVITETEVVRVQATSSVVPEVLVEEEAAAAQAEAPLEDAAAKEASAAETALLVEEPVTEEAPATETALPVEATVDEQVVKDQDVVEDEHDEL
ncbi:uncharacterized protein LY79DRAFT_577252 [Colletotrichum navitas]|uniref:Pathway-specific nitrogen regulator n=1 Tax=Colletotrichum navitas TaxID=681940 RepID=A0AAD8Q7L5_9PEZI|nr:uncharacterized protein LY79DRAFT_577252 [Colletotrichum navitas]KAK1596711.1 hypothetical protein LY79DRAFT_577252 [Colletotrichum navitas]